MQRQIIRQFKVVETHHIVKSVDLCPQMRIDQRRPISNEHAGTFHEQTIRLRTPYPPRRKSTFVRNNLDFEAAVPGEVSHSLERVRPLLQVKIVATQKTTAFHFRPPQIQRSPIVLPRVRIAIDIHGIETVLWRGARHFLKCCPAKLSTRIPPDAIPCGFHLLHIVVVTPAVDPDVIHIRSPLADCLGKYSSGHAQLDKRAVYGHRINQLAPVHGGLEEGGGEDGGVLGGGVEDGGTEDEGGTLEDGGTEDEGGTLEDGGTEEDGGALVEGGGVEVGGVEDEGGGVEEGGTEHDGGGVEVGGGADEDGGADEAGSTPIS